MQPDGSLAVEERITFSYSGSFNGANRDIPLRRGESIDGVTVSENGVPYEPGGNTELGSIDTPSTYGVETSASRIRVVWHYRATNELRTYAISYRFRGLAVAYDDVVDIDLQVWGGHWPAPLDDLRATIVLPRPAELDASYRVWGHPGWVHGVTERTREAVRLRAVGVGSRQYVELRVLFPRRLLASTEGSRVRKGDGLTKIVREETEDARSTERDRERIEDAKRHLWRTLLYLLLLGLGPAAAVVAAVWAVHGRERKTGYDREYEQAPPTETHPALVPPLLRQGTAPGSLEFTATLFDLIRRGHYRAEPVTTEKSVWGGLRHEEIADLELSPGTPVELEVFEEPVVRVFDDVLELGPERLSRMRDRIETKRQTNANRFDDFKEQVAEAIKGRKWYSSGGARALGLGIAAFVVVAVVLLWLGIDGWRAAAPRWSDVVLVALGGCAAANAAVLLAATTRIRIWRRRTRAGQQEAERWEAFRRYLTDFPRLDEAPPATLELWERYLVYGIAFGIAERVLQGAQLHMPQELHDASSVYWISPSGDLGSGPSALAIGDLSAGFGSALSPPSSSGSGGYGGGFSGGGGGGGGGGGAW